ncbi:hypothetical protein DF3PB_1900003 [uncultured Defluviicoccus sp.]|uniref:Uncharacterized protein n=1 Tax=metagenome TaxID=256318 RepID=A0A380TB81_9ZZZZ|nr:hypothetical protein DF3PB_1900003 [uncultured Defluviicoccus sp.]
MLVANEAGALAPNPNFGPSCGGALEQGSAPITFPHWEGKTFFGGRMAPEGPTEDSGSGRNSRAGGAGASEREAAAWRRRHFFWRLGGAGDAGKTSGQRLPPVPAFLRSSHDIL